MHKPRETWRHAWGNWRWIAAILLAIAAAVAAPAIQGPPNDATSPIKPPQSILREAGPIGAPGATAAR